MMKEKINKSVLEQYINSLEIDNDNNVEVPTDIICSLFFSIIKKEIEEYIKTHYILPVILTNDEIKKIANALQRNSDLVLWYVKKIELDNSKIKYSSSQKESSYDRTIKEITEYFLKRGENTPISINEIVNTIDIDIRTLYLVVDTKVFLFKIIYHDRCNDFSRKNEICLSDKYWKDIHTLIYE